MARALQFLYNGFVVVLCCYFLSRVISSSLKLHDRPLGTTLKKKSSFAVMYPSVTACVAISGLEIDLDDGFSGLQDPMAVKNFVLAIDYSYLGKGNNTE